MRISKATAVFMLIAVLGAVLAVGHTSEAEEPLQIAGRWFGTITHRVNGADQTGELELIITQRGEMISGTFTVRDRAMGFSPESLTGRIDGRIVTIVVGRGSDAITMRGSIAGPKPTRLAGTFRIGPASPDIGMWSITR